MKAFLHNVVRRTGVRILAITCCVLVTLIATGCVSAPPQVVLLHAKEGEMLKDLRRTHLAMVDAYVDKKIEIFDTFYFKEYAVKYRQRWETAFAARMGRPYDPDRDFSTFSNDLVASYLSNVEPLNKLRADLRDQITVAHDQIAQAHQTVGAWIQSVEKLNSSQRETANKLLGAIDSSLSMEKIETRIDEVTTRLINKLK
jgi:hypothetical protein